MKTQVRMLVLSSSLLAVSCGTVSEGAVTPDATGMDVMVPVASGPSGADSMVVGEQRAVVPATPLGEVASDQAMPVEEVGSDESMLDVAPDAMRTADLPLAASNVLPAGRFVGDLVLDETRQRVAGAGPAETVIVGDLVVASQCVVTGLTVTGDVVFRGNHACVTVDLGGQILDYGVGNRH